MNQPQQARAWARLEEAFQQLPDLLAGPNSPTPEFKAWTETVSRALRLGFSEDHLLVRDFEALTMVHTAYAGQVGVAGSFRQHEQRTPPHEVLGRAKGLIEDAIEVLVQGTSAAAESTSTASTPQFIVLPADPGTADAGGGHPKALISYAWESEDHKGWVRELARELRHRGVDVSLDRWQVHPGDQLPAFMEQAIRESDFVVIICTPTYKEKSEGRQGGVGYEGHIMTAELFIKNNQRKFIPVLRAASYDSALPVWLAGKSTLDLRGDGFGKEFEELVTTLRGERESPPPLGPAPKARTSDQQRFRSPEARPPKQTGSPTDLDAKGKPESRQPIRILGVIEEDIGIPRMDGTRGSALYEVALQLSQRPPRRWGDLFVQTWDRPPQFTTMHRPGIARVAGDRVILNGTTIDEVEKYHRDTLKLVIEEVNKKFGEIEEERDRREEAEQAQLREHQESTRRKAREIKFD
jgi:hypothetical protein